MPKKLLIFDLDGTLYQFEGGSFRNSGLNKKVLANAFDYIKSKLNKTDDEAEGILMEIKEKYGEDISLALEKEYSLDRYDYFDTVWNIPAREFIKSNPKLADILNDLGMKYILAVVSDAPKIWVGNVLRELRIDQIFGDNVFTGEGDERKGFGNSFERVFKKYSFSPEDCISIGDQETTDIIPAKDMGMATIFVNQDKSEGADSNINDISALPQALVSLEQKGFLIKYLQEKEIDISSLKKLAGSSDSSAFLCANFVYKVGPIAEIMKEFNVYQRFKDAMTNYRSVFPSVEVVSENDELGILRIEYLGGATMEDECLKFSIFNYQFSNLSNQIAKLEKLNKQVLDKIGILFDETKAINDDGSAFFEEILSALEINLGKAGLLDEAVKKKLQDIRTRKEKFLSEFIGSLAHKNLSVGNIIVSDDKNDVRFIDPRSAIPYLEKSAARGNVAIDLIGYYVSLERKDLEIQRKNPKISLEPLKIDVMAEIDKYEGEAFTKELQDLCFCYWYSVYAACKCEYCTAQERLWLYEEMVKRTRQLFNVI